MLNGVHAHTTHLGPAVTLHLVLVISTTSFQQRFVDTTTTSNNTNARTVERRDHFLDTRRQLDSSHSCVFVVGDNSSVTARCSSQLSTIARFLFHIADDGTLRHNSHRKDVSNLQCCLLPTVDKLTGMHTLSGNEEFLSQFELVRISEDDNSKWSTSTRVMDDLLDNSFDVTISFSIVQRSQFCCSLSKFLMSSENTSGTFSLTTDDSAHFS